MQTRPDRPSFFRSTTRTGGPGSFGGFGQAEPLAAPIERTGAERVAFLRRVYGWMFAGMIATVFGVAISVKAGIAEGLLTQGFLPSILMFVAWIGLAYVVQRVRHVPTWNVVAFAAYGFFTGIVISSMCYVAILLAQAKGLEDGTFLLQAGGLTLVAFAGLTAYAFFSKRDFSFLRSFLVVGSFVLLGALLIGFFVESTGYHLAISSAGILLMLGFTLYDTQRVLRTYPDGEHVAGAMTLFLDFVMLFVYVLRFVLLLAGGSRD